VGVEGAAPIGETVDIQASSTCKWLKHKKRSDADLAKSCLSLKMAAMNITDVKILTAIYKLFMDGGEISIKVPSEELTLSGTMRGIRHINDEANT
jgi:hypothetical protein